MSLDVSSIGMHYLSIGYALGASVSVNPVAKLRLNGYFHFVPSASLLLSGTSINLGFMPYCRYGAEITYDWIGIGLEWGSGMSNMSDLMTSLTSEMEGMEIEAQKSKYYSNYMQIYLAFKFGKKKNNR